LLDNSDCLLNGAPYGALIGKIGNGTPFIIGSGMGKKVSEDGTLQLAINDQMIYYEDNSGSYSVTIKLSDTTAAQEEWVQGFAKPILNDVHKRQPNFEDDFSDLNGVYDRWNYILGDVTFAEGVMRMNTPGGDDGSDAGGSMFATDFVFEFDFIPRITSVGSMAAAYFRWNDTEGYSFEIALSDGWWELGSLPAGQDYLLLMNGRSDVAELNRATHVTIVIKDKRFAFYINDEPLAYFEDISFGADWAGPGVWSPEGTAEVDFDNVKFWDLNNLKP
jgi:hypothetical protein